MKCPKCGHEKSIVVESRKFEGNPVRKRECIKCGHNYKTVEVPYDGQMRDPRPYKPKEKTEKPINNIATDVFNVWR